MLLTGTSNTVSAAQATALSALAAFGLASGASLAVSDSAANLLAGSNAAGVGKASSVTLAGINVVTAAQAADLAGLAQISVPTGATLVVTDNAVNLLTNSGFAAIATGVSLTGSNVVTAYQATSLAELPGFAMVTGATLVVADAAANLLAADDAPRGGAGDQDPPQR